MKSNMKKET